MSGRAILAVLTLLLARPGWPAEVGESASRTLVPFPKRTVTAQVIAVDRESRRLLVRVHPEGKPPRELSLSLDERTEVKRRHAPGRPEDLQPGQWVRVGYHADGQRLVAHRIEVRSPAAR